MHGQKQTACVATWRSENTAVLTGNEDRGGVLLRRLQAGERIGLPHSRPMPSIGKRCHELRIPDDNLTWRIIYQTHADAIVIGEVFAKKTNATPKKVIDACKRRFKKYEEDTQ